MFTNKTTLTLRSEALPPGIISGEALYSLLFAEPQPTRPDYGWMNRRVSRTKLPPPEARKMDEYKAWLKRDGSEGNEARPDE